MGTRPPLQLAGGKPASSSEQDWSDEAHAALKATFGFDSFRGHQLEAIQAALNGRDCFVLMPTGGGKSMCYSLVPAIRPGLVLVVSPLIALMQDQVQSLRARGLRADHLSSSRSPAERQRLLADLEQRQPATQLLFATPELLATEGFRRCLRGAYAAGALRLVAVDEAHCISDLGHDFRPAYRQLGAVRRELPRLPLMALTATASAAVQDDIVRQLGLRSPLQLAASFNRPNISYQVRYVDLLRDSEGRPLQSPLPDIVALLAGRGQQGQQGQQGGSAAAPACAIVYCHKREEVDATAAALQARGVPAAAYHAGLPDAQRAAVLSGWQARRVAVVVATVAFGMGIDRGDVRCVVHHSLPASLEAFYQEAGRAGRDGLPATSIVYFSQRDRRRRQFLLGAEQRRRRRQGQASSDGRDQLQQFGQVVTYCLSASCRRAAVLQHFGEAPPPRPPGVKAAAACCDVCADAAAVAAQLREVAAGEQQQRLQRVGGGQAAADCRGAGGGLAQGHLEFERSWAAEGLDFDQEGPSRALSDSGGEDAIEGSDEEEEAAAAAAMHRAKACCAGGAPDQLLAALERAEEEEERRQGQQGSKRARLMRRLESGGGGGNGGGGQPAELPMAVHQAACRQLAAVLGGNPALAACVGGREEGVAAALVRGLAGGRPSKPVFQSLAANLALQLRRAAAAHEVPALQAALHAATGAAEGCAGTSPGEGQAAAALQLDLAAAGAAAGAAGTAHTGPGLPLTAERLRARVAEAARLAGLATRGDDAQRVGAAVGALRRLQDAPVTAQLLQHSGAGKHVRRLGKHGVPAVAEAAAAAERAWRARLAGEQQG